MKKIMVLLLAISLLLLGNAMELKAANKLPEFSLVSQNTALTNQNVKVKVVLKKGVKAKQILWKAGKSTKSAKKYWKKAKNITKGKAFYATGNGWYSVKITDKKNRVKRKSIFVSNIDQYSPVSYWNYTVENQTATVSVFAADEWSGISFVGYARGYLQSKNISNYMSMSTPLKEAQVYVKGTMMSPTHQFLADQPGYWTVCMCDNAGNVALLHVYIQLWEELSNLTPFDSYGGGCYEGTIYDRWEKAYTNCIGMSPNAKGERFVEYYLNGAYKKLSGTVVRGKGIKDTNITWLEILADGVVIYTSPKMDYKSQAVPFEVDLANAKYIKIRAYLEGSDTLGANWANWNAASSGGIYLTDAKLYN